MINGYKPMPKNPKLSGDREVLLDKSWELLRHVGVHPVVLRPRLLHGVDIGAGPYRSSRTFSYLKVIPQSHEYLHTFAEIPVILIPRQVTPPCINKIIVILNLQNVIKCLSTYWDWCQARRR